MAFSIPPCPKCSGVLREQAFDAARCRCGFEVDSLGLRAAARLPEGERAAYLVARGNMVPIPQHEPGIRVGRDAAALHEIGWDHRWSRWRYGEMLADLAATEGAPCDEVRRRRVQPVERAAARMGTQQARTTMSERVQQFRQEDGFIYLGGLSIGDAVVPPTDLLTLLQVLSTAIAVEGTDEQRDIARKIFRSWLP